jgi:ubiquinone/menaquinone biosynthesis C-methylase UbiE
VHISVSQANFENAVGAHFASRTNYEKEPGTWHPRVAQKLVDSIDLRAGERVLDIATGSGLAARFASAKVGSSGSVVGIDSSQTMLNQAREKISNSKECNIELIEQDANELNFAPKSFDAIFCCEALALMRNHPRLMKHWNGFLKPKGKLAFTAYSANSMGAYGFKKAFEEAVNSPAPDTIFDALGSADKCRALMNESGFEKVEILKEVELYHSVADANPISHDFLRILFKGHHSVDVLSADVVYEIFAKISALNRCQKGQPNRSEHIVRYYVTGTKVATDLATGLKEFS